MAKRRYNNYKRRKKRIGKFTVFGVIVLALVVCGTIFYKQSVLNAQSREYSKQITELKKQKKEVDKETEKLKDYKNYVNSDEFIEETAREKLGLVHKNEIIFEPDDK